VFNLDDFRSDDAFLILSDMEGVSGLIDDRRLSSSLEAFGNAMEDIFSPRM